ncbi:hypothetical protein ANN_20305 [Periplaneta americana]|uniref:Reverse transcriptase zinc-binding domain-containing protein n=1 Tax=Periplaneta americana TaxID=6978 RepID=A0ABQ8SCJ7_PERAM|nr:hypothetical protein ANN_20305 [Periplaneta americana]
MRCCHMLQTLEEKNYAIRFPHPRRRVSQTIHIIFAVLEKKPKCTDHPQLNKTDMGQNTNTSLPFTSIKRLIKNTYKIKQNQALCTKAKDKKWSILIKKPEIIPEIPRKSAVAKFRLLTEHDYLAKHLNKIGIYTNPNCPLCNKEEEMTEDHLITCEVLPDGSTTEKYWRARTLMASLPKPGVG